MRKHSNRQLKLVDLIRIVSQYARSDDEVRLAVADLINRGRIKLEGRFHNHRVVVG